MVNVAGFENTLQIAQGLRSMVGQFGEEVLDDKDKFISLMNDFIPEFERERRLLKSALNNGLLSVMRKESNQKFAITRVKDILTNEMFLSGNAVEFVMVCLTYVFGWEYEPDPAQVADAPAAPQQPVQEAPAVSKAAAPAENVSDAEMKQKSMELRVFRASDAAKYRLRGNVKIAEGFTMIDLFCFDGFGFMKNVELPSTLLAVGQYAFSDCKRLKAVSIPPGVVQIGQGAFNACAKLTVIRIPHGVTEIEDSTFSFCHSLEIVEMPTSVGSIGSEAFAGCTSLKKLFIPDSVKYIADDAFAHCSPMLMIKCYTNSYVHRFCAEHGLSTELINKGAIFG